MSEQTVTVRYSGRQLARARELLARFDGALGAARFYPEVHPMAQETVGAFHDVLGRYHREGVDVVLTFIDGEALLGEQLLPQESMLFDGLIRDIASSGGVTLTFTRGLELEECHDFIRALAGFHDHVDLGGGVSAALAEAPLEHIGAETVSVLGDTLADESAAGAYAEAVTLIHEIDRQSITNRDPDPRRITRTVRSLVDHVLADRSAMLVLTGLHEYDQYTFYHSANVAVLAVALGSMISRDHRFLSTLGVAGLMHDIGKLQMPKEMINKPGALSAEEWKRMRAHPVVGAQMVAAMRGIDKAAIVAVLEHHQRFDRGGYPRPVVRGPQNLVSRIVELADAYDAMTSRRSYSAARMHDQALDIIAASSGTAFDPVLVKLLARMLGAYPPRSVVRLSDGRLAIVVAPGTNDLEKPVVRVVADPDLRLVDPYDVVLEDEPGLAVSETIDPRLLNIEVDDYV